MEHSGSVVMAHGLSCSAACGMWDLPGPWIEPMSPALAGGFLTTGEFPRTTREGPRTRLLDKGSLQM